MSFNSLELLGSKFDFGPDVDNIINGYKKEMEKLELIRYIKIINCNKSFKLLKPDIKTIIKKYNKINNTKFTLNYNKSLLLSRLIWIYDDLDIPHYITWKRTKINKVIIWLRTSEMEYEWDIYSWHNSYAYGDFKNYLEGDSLADLELDSLVDL